MEAIEMIFWSSLSILFYTYIGYGGITFVIAKLSRRTNPDDLDFKDLPEITHVIAAYNEEDLIKDKIINCYNLEYPKSKIKTIVVADGSTDKTVEIVKRYPWVQLYFSPERKGKLAAVDRVMKEVDTPITVFSDANSMINFDGIRKMVRHFQLNTVGGVAGEKVVINEEKDDAASAGEGIYWKYESFLKKLDYQVHSVVGAAGELFAVRTHLFETPAKDALIEDFLITMSITEKGYRVAYEPEAKAKEYASANIGEELKRKVRISAGGLQSVWKLRSLLNPFKHGLLTFQYVSHRAIRWTLAPIALFLMLITSTVLITTGSDVYSTLLLGQLGFYGLSVVGYFAEHQKIRLKALFVPFYFTFMNLSVYIGLIKLITGEFNVKWEKAGRRVASGVKPAIAELSMVRS
ncbi:MAG: glycosyltransferase family 2 protein [Cyclobacteriaceae bacterium]